MLKLARQAAGATQESFAASLGVDATTVQSWESGRRPLTAVRTTDLLRLRMQLARAGAPADTARYLFDALDADMVLSAAIEGGDVWQREELHPLSATVHRRTLMNLVTWPVTGQLPVQLAGLAPKRPHRGPTPVSPYLSDEEQTRLFDHLFTVSLRATQPSESLLRRQAIYLLSFDRRRDTSAWLRGEWSRATRGRSSDDLSGLLGVRSAAVTRASIGDTDTLHDFVASLDSERAATANLNYWAHWLGELPSEQASDDFMVTVDPRSWAGLHLAAHLTGRLDPASPHLVLNLHSLHALIALRPGLLTDWPLLRTRLAAAVERLHGYDSLGKPMHDELAGLAYAVRLANR
ncbi:helix-turn-helix transcriptional regulator [Amycolatopsis minnesotensis]|uniref:helix-turn-helix domain-containing protein n=1 Tax=Amycolatopsis minnesotensis TaxID=337894 RepID=UPI0031E2A28D